MANLWPWLLVAGSGALHGLNPINGWWLAAERQHHDDSAAPSRHRHLPPAGPREPQGRMASPVTLATQASSKRLACMAWLAASATRVRTGSMAALASLAAGHALSVACVAAAAVWGLGAGIDVDANSIRALGIGLLIALAGIHAIARLAARRHPASPGGRPCAPPGHLAITLWSFVVATAQGAGWMLVPAFVPLCSGDAAVREITASGSLALALGAVAVHLAAMLATTGLSASGACQLLRLLDGLRRHHGIIATDAAEATDAGTDATSRPPPPREPNRPPTRNDPCPSNRSPSTLAWRKPWPGSPPPR